MTIGVLKFILFIHDSNSLKAKRMVLHSLKARLRNNFNIAVTQVADEDKWQKASMVAVGVERDKRNVDALLSRVVNFIESFGAVSLVDYEIELL
jgi:hypothetical protein